MDTLDDTAFRPRRAKTRMRKTLLALCAVSTLLTGCAGNPDNTNGTLTGEGATSQQNAINLFADVLIPVSYTHLRAHAT